MKHSQGEYEERLTARCGMKIVFFREVEDDVSILNPSVTAKPCHLPLTREAIFGRSRTPSPTSPLKLGNRRGRRPRRPDFLLSPQSRGSEPAVSPAGSVGASA